MSTCEAKTELELAEERVEELKRELKEAEAEKSRAKESFKLPPFFKNIELEAQTTTGACVGCFKQMDKAYQIWMLNQLAKCNALSPISGRVVFSENQIEKIYNIAIDCVPAMREYPKFPEKFIPKR